MKLFRSAAGALLATGLLAGSAVVPASAHYRGSVEYVALGDSYAAGVGAPPYTDEACGISTVGYPELLDNRRRIDLETNRACSGDTVEDVVAELDYLNRRTDLVTLTVGGNDVGYESIILACGQGADTCRSTIDAALANAHITLAPALAALHAEIAAAAPKARVVVTGYPHLFSPEFGTTITVPQSPLVLTPTEQQIINEGTDILNGIIRTQATEAGFTYVDVVDRFEGHGLGSAKPWIQPFTDLARLHPTEKGYKNGYFPEIRRAVKHLG